MAFTVKACIFDVSLRLQSVCWFLQENQNIVDTEVVDSLAFTVKVEINSMSKYSR